VNANTSLGYRRASAVVAALVVVALAVLVATRAALPAEDVIYHNSFLRTTEPFATVLELVAPSRTSGAAPEVEPAYFLERPDGTLEPMPEGGPRLGARP
jgi:hypothetical protein